MDPHSSFTDLARKYSDYGEELARHGHALEGRDIPMARLMAIAEDRERAETVAQRGVRWLTNSYVEASRGEEISDLRSHEARAAGEAHLLEGDTTRRYLDEAVVWGTPEEVADQLLALRESIQLHYLLAAPLSHETFLLLTERVLPRIL